MFALVLLTSLRTGCSREHPEGRRVQKAYLYDAGRKAGLGAGRAEWYEAGQKAGHDADRTEED
jgi:hypothetical protein